MMKSGLIAGFALLIGLWSGWVIWGRDHSPWSAEYHWKKVAEYRRLVEDPASYEKRGRFSVASETPDVTANLAGLVSMNELNRRDIIVPGLLPHLKRTPKR